MRCSLWLLPLIYTARCRSWRNCWQRPGQRTSQQHRQCRSLARRLMPDPQRTMRSCRTQRMRIALLRSLHIPCCYWHQQSTKTCQLHSRYTRHAPSPRRTAQRCSWNNSRYFQQKTAQQHNPCMNLHQPTNIFRLGRGRSTGRRRLYIDCETYIGQPRRDQCNRCSMTGLCHIVLSGTRRSMSRPSRCTFQPGKPCSRCTGFLRCRQNPMRAR